MSSYRRQKKSAPSASGSFWLSFSDMMSVLVLIFIFVIFSMIYNLKQAQDDYVAAHNEYEIARAALEASEAEKANLIVLVSDYENQITELEDELEETNRTLIVIAGEKDDLQSQLDDKDTIILDLNSQVSENETELIRLRDYNTELETQNAALYNTSLNDKAQLSLYEQRLTEAQRQLDALLGVKSEIIQQLSNELKRNGINVDVDQNTGSIVLPSSMMFNSGKAELSQAGRDYLDRFLPVYLSVLLSDQFSEYVAEIIIEGHTDSTPRGGYPDAYLGNLDLSLDRAQAVADYVLEPTYMQYRLGLDMIQMEAFRQVVTTSGRSYSDLKLDRFGNEDSVASRRVEIKFRLIDAESVYATRQIIIN